MSIRDHWAGRALRHPSFVIGLLGTLAFIGLALLSAVWTPHVVDRVNIAARFAPLFGDYLLGTDHLGRDIASMLMRGALTSLTVAAVAVGIGLVIGVPLGLAAAIVGGPFEWLILRVNDFLFAFPALIVAVLITTLFGPGATNAMLAIGIFNIPVFARVARGGALSLKSLDYVAAARLAGLSSLAIARKHLLPNIASLVIVQATIQLSLGILAEAGLSYVGLGTQPPGTSLGLMLRDAQSIFLLHPHLAMVPGLAIMFIVVSLNLAGDGLRDLIDPRLRKEGLPRVAA
ncbi:ABC transporter permease [Arsenicitalea aurantiaca]|uniref:ABC transporter permease n=1 Tax=Arsenicitalea aurantiaca TaxID=1783274 RepID=A0A433XAZ1_9HYPH|nr:ABC transporter permease [Arsenicitalea aurantiaca]RUT31224.1 ABC transporter permease [Arsenicitalea aurantiaca]